MPLCILRDEHSVHVICIIDSSDIYSSGGQNNNDKSVNVCENNKKRPLVYLQSLIQVAVTSGELEQEFLTRQITYPLSYINEIVTN